MLKVLLAQERKKAATLGTLLVLLALVGVRGWLKMSPRTGRAAQATDAPAMSSLASAGRNAVDRAKAFDDALRPGRTISVSRSPRLTRDLFIPDPAYFPLPTQPTEPEALNAAPPPEPVESPAENADDDAKRREAQLVQETAGWRLSSVVLGHQPTAVVETDGPSGRACVVRVGQSVRDWAVIEITSSTVVFEKESIRVRLSLSKHDR